MEQIQMNRELKYSGILKIALSKDFVEPLLPQLPKGAIALQDNQFHITLVRSGVLKDKAKEINSYVQHHPAFKLPPPIALGSKIYQIDREEQGRRSWILLCKDQDAHRKYVSMMMGALGLHPMPEPYRVYHVSLANLTGSPYDSVGDVDVGDFA
jgi:hypothetical protein